MAPPAAETDGAAAPADGRSVLLLPTFDRNPYTRLLGDGLQRRGWTVVAGTPQSVLDVRAWRSMPRVVHLHWEQPWVGHRGPRRAALESARLVAFLLAMRATRRRVVWTVHNLADHERQHPRIERALQLAIARVVHEIVVHYPAAAALVRARHRPGRTPIAVMPMPSYGDAHGKPVERSTARRRLRLGPEDRVFLAFGAVRPYKRLPALVEAFRSVPDERLRLVVAGWPLRPRDAVAVEDAAGDDERITTRMEYIDDDEAALLLSAADVFVLPSRDQLTSSSLVVAMDFGLAVVAADQPHARYLCGNDGAAYFDPEEPGSLADALSAAATADTAAMGERNQKAVRQVSWDDAAAVLEDVYRR